MTLPPANPAALSTEGDIGLLVELAQDRVWQGAVDQPTAHYQDRNRLCGDELELSCLIDNGIIIDVRWQGIGCLLSQGAAAHVCDRLRGQALATVQDWTDSQLLGGSFTHISIYKQQCILLAVTVWRRLSAQLNQKDEEHA
jgi:nitrogen fixation NifU-like protein